MGGPREGLRTINDARALAALPQRPVSPMLALTEGTADLIVFMDGEDGWFELDANALPPGTEIGMHGPRFLDAFTGNTHVPLYCWGSTTRPGKIIWVIQDAEIARDFAFCNRRRMDLRPLRPLSAPVTMIDADLTEAEVSDLRTRIAADATVRAVSLPPGFRPFTHQRVIETPYHWTRLGTGRATLFLQDQMTEAVAAHLGPLAPDADIVVQDRAVSFLTDTMGFGDRAATQAMGAGVALDGTSVILPDLAVSRFRITVTCTPAACDALNGFDAAPLLEDHRRPSELDQALGEALPIARTPDDQMPSPAALRDPATTLGETEPITYPVRYIERPQSD
ncbi:hypothetical protein [Gymnodinialimonas sp.]